MAGLWAYHRDGFSVSAYVRVYDNDFTKMERTPLGESGYDRRKTTHEMLIVSPVLIDEVLQRSEINGLDLVQSQEEPRELLRDAIEVKFVGDSELMRDGRLLIESRPEF